jgi:hypothetical protein
MHRDQYYNFVTKLRRDDAIGLSYIRFAYALSIGVAHTSSAFTIAAEHQAHPPCAQL